ncbi:GAF and ANTAR domain-containing protein [Geodermatophilus sp. SYSU D01106]
MTGPGDPTETGASTDRPDALLSRIARRLQREHGDVESLLAALTHAAVTSVPGAEAASISYIHERRHVTSRAATADLPRDLDEAQDRLHEGPCLDAVWDHRFVLVEDMASEPRWPRFAAEASALGVGSSLSLQLIVAGDRLGALNLYARTPGAFGVESVDTGLAIASHAAIALAGAQTEHHLRTAIDSRDLIGQAKGILMERYKLTAAQAFAVLVRASQEANRKVVDVAMQLCDTGAWSGSPRSGDRLDAAAQTSRHDHADHLRARPDRG